MFIICKSLLYYKRAEADHLVIFTTMRDEIFRLTHNENSYIRLYQCYQQIFKSLYVYRFTHYLKKYLQHCSACQLNQIKHHCLYNALTSITSLNLSFHTVIMNFIDGLSEVKLIEYNIILSVMNKFLKRITLLLDKDIHTAVN